jgi:hypothetical protein
VAHHAVHRRNLAVALTAVLSAAGILAACGTAAIPAARSPDCGAAVAAITDCGLRDRLDALARLTADSVGFRAVGTSGLDAAGDGIETELRSAGWRITADAFTTSSFTDLGGSSLVVDDRSFGAGDMAPLIFAPSGDVTGPVVAIDWDPAAREPDGSGCAVADYGRLPHGAIVLVRSGPCLRRDQVLAAQQAGAAAFVAGYPSAATGQVLRPTLLEPTGLAIPAASASRAAAMALASAATRHATARLVTLARTAWAKTRSVIAELTGSEPDKVVMLGAHLDSVIDGPGINDNGSGVAALLEIARALRDSRPRATIRLAFWSGEEFGLLGSVRYVASLSAQDRSAILVYLNADMVASPNGYAGVYDEATAPPGSSAVRDLLMAAVKRAGGVPVTVDLGGGSDHLAFDRAGIATGGVFSGAHESVSEEQASASGSTAGLPADPCYHLVCDDGSDLDIGLAHILASALADVTVQLSNDPTLPPG